MSSYPGPVIPTWNFGLNVATAQHKVDADQLDSQLELLKTDLSLLKVILDGFLRGDDFIKDDYIRLFMLHPEITNAFLQDSTVLPGIPYGEILFSNGVNGITSAPEFTLDTIKGLLIDPALALRAKRWSWLDVERMLFETVTEDASAEDQFRWLTNMYLDDALTPTHDRHLVHKKFVDDLVAAREAFLQAQINTNATNIATNTTNITTNATNIATNTTNIATNTTNIATNATNIASNDVELADHESRISQNESDIASLSGAVKIDELTGGATPYTSTGTLVATAGNQYEFFITPQDDTSFGNHTGLIFHDATVWRSLDYSNNLTSTISVNGSNQVVFTGGGGVSYQLTVRVVKEA